ncbi:major facilitator family transporter [Legionella parisiensis]|uniref:Proline/betaine transporter n=1 Tax=Legionella parisiensis TaxID=45071 RepID=A0A1E5JN41_9GAMM|nr:MFS transporter [Legionella parisiensis]KTD44306.1 major facilitator family transporter [Legionella parisiensis]OEH45939.1 Proline/betaine transporter [Legionella parisiensis]STX71932.1 major facilitator family transporter [Legionella parisiensis]
MNKEQYKIVTLTALGGALEFYDFTIYALFAPYISQNFFANTNTLIGLMNTFAVFALGYLARPIGGIFFGHLGDKFGRKSAFSLAVFMMATATLLMGCLPSYHSIGITAPIILMVLRLMQGFSVGGEIPGAAVFTIEHVPQEKRGFAIGLVFMCITLGNSLGALVGFILTSLLNQVQMMAWGWRIPFIIGFGLGIISYMIRKQSIETPVFLNMVKEEKLHRQPFWGLWTLSREKLFHAFLFTAVSSSIISLFLYLPAYLTSIVKLKVTHTYLINLVSFLSFALFTAVFGSLSDRCNRKKLLIFGALLLILSCYPLFYGLNHLGESFVWVFTLCFALFGAMINGSYVVLISESFPTHLRYSGVGFSYSLGIALFGGAAPLAFTQLIQVLKLSEAPALYLLLCACVTLIAILRSNQQEKNYSNTTGIIAA